MELNSKQFKQPHQMSPEEFAAHPAAVFHGTYLPDEDVFNLEKRNPDPILLDNDTTIDEYRNGDKRYSYVMDPVKKIHLGTFQAALETLNNRRKPFKDQEATVHVFWQTPKVSGTTIDAPLKKYNPNITEWTDYVTRGEPEITSHYAPGAQYYINQNEDVTSTSFATDTPEKHLVSQADYVKAALDKGVPESEIHPRTLAQYKSGTLGKIKMLQSTATLMRKNPNKLGPLKGAGPKEEYIRSRRRAPKRPQE